MGILLAFLPFIVFALLDRLVGPLPGLAAATAVAIALVVKDLFSTHHTPKILELGSIVLFGGLALYTLIAKPDLSIMGVRLLVDFGLLLIILIILISLAIGMPFTEQYAREQVPREQWSSPVFRRINLAITAVWALALVVIVVTDAVLLLLPDTPTHAGTLVIVAALVIAFKFTTWYPNQGQAASDS
ncbi:MAG: hypothetical protein AB7E55_15640 [Pigmentiphaga sp.]